MEMMIAMLTLARSLNGSATGVIMILVGLVLGVYVARPKTPDYWSETFANCKYGRRIG